MAYWSLGSTGPALRVLPFWGCVPFLFTFTLAWRVRPGRRPGSRLHGQYKQFYSLCSCRVNGLFGILGARSWRFLLHFSRFPFPLSRGPAHLCAWPLCLRKILCKAARVRANQKTSESQALIPGISRVSSSLLDGANAKALRYQLPIQTN